LQGRNVTIWPDADEPGRDAAIKVAECLNAIGAASIKIAQLPAELPQGWDLADKIPASIKPQQVLSEAKPYREKTDYEDAFGTLSEVKAEEVSWLGRPYFVRGATTVLDGNPGQGKSTFLTAVAAAVTTDQDLPFILI
jgi:hypothetical protein